jgi:hypothetical protein
VQGDEREHEEPPEQEQDLQAEPRPHLTYISQMSWLGKATAGAGSGRGAGPPNWAGRGRSEGRGLDGSLVRALLPLQRALLGAVGPLSSLIWVRTWSLGGRSPPARWTRWWGRGRAALPRHSPRAPAPPAYGTTRGDLTLFSQVVLIAYAAVLLAPGGLDGPYLPVVYAWSCSPQGSRARPSPR